MAAVALVGVLLSAGCLGMQPGTGTDNLAAGSHATPDGPMGFAQAKEAVEAAVEGADGWRMRGAWALELAPGATPPELSRLAPAAELIADHGAPDDLLGDGRAPMWILSYDEDPPRFPADRAWLVVVNGDGIFLFPEAGDRDDRSALSQALYSRWPLLGSGSRASSVIMEEARQDAEFAAALHDADALVSVLRPDERGPGDPAWGLLPFQQGKPLAGTAVDAHGFNTRTLAGTYPADDAYLIEHEGEASAVEDSRASFEVAPSGLLQIHFQVTTAGSGHEHVLDLTDKDGRSLVGPWQWPEPMSHRSALAYEAPYTWSLESTLQPQNGAPAPGRYQATVCIDDVGVDPLARMRATCADLMPDVA